MRFPFDIHPQRRKLTSWFDGSMVCIRCAHDANMPLRTPGSDQVDPVKFQIFDQIFFNSQHRHRYNEQKIKRKLPDTVPTL